MSIFSPEIGTREIYAIMHNFLIENPGANRNRECCSSGVYSISPGFLKGHMPRKISPDTGRLDRLISLVSLLSNPAGAARTTAELAAELRCGLTTVARDIEALPPLLSSLLGDVLTLETLMDGHSYAYRLKRKPSPDTLGLAGRELLFLDLCRAMAPRFLSPEQSAGMRSLLTQQQLALTELAEGPVLFHGKGSIDYTPHLATAEILRGAIAERKVCALSYRAKGRSAPRRFRLVPRRILAMNQVLYLEAFHLEAGSLLPARRTTLLVHRISDASLTGEHAAPLPQNEDTTGFGLYWHPPRQFTVRIAPEAADYVLDRHWPGAAPPEILPDGSLRLTLTSTSEKEVQAWVWSFGGRASLDPPPALPDPEHRSAPERPEEEVSSW
jgi:predicted DNA-binding transcriptional regulator YafY